MDLIGPALGGLVFIALMSLVREPTRRTLNAVIVGGAGGVYISGGGFGMWELPYAFVATPIAWMGLRSHRYIGIAWLMHAAWDLAHHLYGNPIWPFMPTSSVGCLIFDSVIAVWFLMDAPAFVRARPEPAPSY
jgi:hypothetical protein